jgi:lipocalin
MQKQIKKIHKNDNEKKVKGTWYELIRIMKQLNDEG